MPIRITKIERQKKNKQRYSLFSEEKFIIGVSEVSLLKFNIHTGITLSDELISQIESGEKLSAIREQAWRFLARRMHSRKELRDKLINKGHDQDEIDKVMNELEEKEYLNDRSFAEQVIFDEINLKKNGPVLISSKLLKKGVDMELVSSLLEEVYHDDLRYQNCRYFAEKKFKSLKSHDEQAVKNKLGGFLVQKGFPWDIINQVISELDI